MAQQPIMQEWTESECWAWKQIEAGQPVFFGKNQFLGKASAPQQWNDLRAAFLRDILCTELVHHITPGGINIFGARFIGMVDLSYVSLECLLMLNYCAFESDVLFLSFQTNKDLSLAGSIVEGKLDFEGARINGLLILGEGHYRNGIVFRRTSVDGQADLNNILVSGPLLCEDMQVQGHLNFRSSKIGEINLRSATLGQLDMTGIQCSGTCILDGIQISDRILLRATDIVSSEGSAIEPNLWQLEQLSSKPIVRGASSFEEVNLTDANVGGQVDLTGAQIRGRLTLDSAKIGGHLFMRCCDLNNHVDLSSAKVNNIIDFRFTSVRGAMDLSGLKVYSFKDYCFDWPQDLKLDGFEYNHLDQDVARRPVQWFRKWLEGRNIYTPQPYQQMAGALKNAGYRDKADEVIYAGRCREWKQVGWRRRLWLFLLWVFIGFGYKTHRALIWIFGLATTGTFILEETDVSNLGSNKVESCFLKK